MTERSVKHRLDVPVRSGLPALLDGEACTDRGRIRRFVRLLRSTRAEMAQAWIEAGNCVFRHNTIVKAVDDLLSLALLTEYVRQRQNGTLPCLQEVFDHTRKSSPRRLFTTVQEQTASQLLRPIFASERPLSGRIIPRSARRSESLAELSAAIREIFPAGMPVSAFGAFRLLCFEQPAVTGPPPEKRSSRASPERHASGIYYTPAALVDCLTCTSLERALEVTGRKAPSLRILDPACGCGAFLVASLRYLLARQAQGHTAPNHWERGVCRKHRRIKNQKRLKQALQWLGSSVNGVDTDAQAVEWTRRCLLLILWESLLEPGSRDMCSTHACPPDLRRTIVQTDFLGMGRRARTEDPPHLRDAADVILGSPPFVRIEQLHAERPEQLAEYRRMFHTARSGRFDLYMLFVEKALRLLRPGGFLGLSISGSFLRSRAGQALRELIGREGRVLEITEFDSRNIYPDCTSHICLLSVRKGASPARARYALVKKGAKVRATLGDLCAQSRRPSDETEVRKVRIGHSAADVWSFSAGTLRLTGGTSDAPACLHVRAPLEADRCAPPRPRSEPAQRGEDGCRGDTHRHRATACHTKT